MPLSGLGALGYKRYWTLAIMRFLEHAPSHVTLESIQAGTAMTLEDIYNTLVSLDMITVRESSTPTSAAFSPYKNPRFRKSGAIKKGPKAPPRNAAQSNGQDGPPPFVPPPNYSIHWDRTQVAQFLADYAKKDNYILRPEKLKWSPLVFTRTLQTKPLDIGVRIPMDVLEDPWPSAVETVVDQLAGPSEPKGVSGLATEEGVDLALGASPVVSRSLFSEQPESATTAVAENTLLATPPRELSLRRTRSSRGASKSPSFTNLRASPTKRIRANHHAIPEEDDEDVPNESEAGNEPPNGSSRVSVGRSTPTVPRIRTSPHKRRIESSPEPDTDTTTPPLAPPTPITPPVVPSAEEMNTPSPGPLEMPRDYHLASHREIPNGKPLTNGHSHHSEYVDVNGLNGNHLNGYTSYVPGDLPTPLSQVSRVVSSNGQGTDEGGSVAPENPTFKVEHQSVPPFHRSEPGARGDCATISHTYQAIPTHYELYDEDALGEEDAEGEEDPEIETGVKGESIEL